MLRHVVLVNVLSMVFEKPVFSVKRLARTLWVEITDLFIRNHLVIIGVPYGNGAWVDCL
jgi:hypothetical protein